VGRVTTATSKIREWHDARLEAAQERLRESSGKADTLEALREIVTGLLGCEEIGLFTVDHAKSRLLWSFGIDAQRHKTLESFPDFALENVMQGEFHMVEAAGGQRGNATRHPLQLFLPIRVNGRTVAVLVLVKLLPQKIEFDESDFRLFNLISNQTGRALFNASSDSHARAARKDG
jgi:GAF domain-containing protein